MMLSLLALSIGSLFVLHLFSERALLARVRDYTEELSTAIEITQEQPGAGADLQKAVQAYADKLRKLGVRDVSIADASAGGGAGLDRSPHRRQEAGAAPGAGGVRDPRRARRRGPPRPPHHLEPHRPHRGRGPAGRLRGHHPDPRRLLRALRDRAREPRRGDPRRLRPRHAAVAVLASAVSRPVQALTDAARRVAAGDLSARVPASGSDELGALARTFNQMVERLGESRALEERLRVAERSTAMGRFASALAHEIRNPLNSISLTIDHVRTRLAPDGRGAARRVPGPDGDAEVGGDAPEPPRRGLPLLRPAGAARPAPVRRGRRRARDGRPRRAQGPRPGHRGRGGRGRGPPGDGRRPRAAQDLRPQPRPERLRGHARGRPAFPRGAARGPAGRAGDRRPRVRHRGGHVGGGGGHRVRAVRLDEGGRGRPRPRPREPDRRGPRRQDRARLDARRRDERAPPPPRASPRRVEPAGPPEARA